MITRKAESIITQVLLDLYNLTKTLIVLMNVLTTIMTYKHPSSYHTLNRF